MTRSPSPEIRAQAAAWLARLRADDRDSRDEGAFQAWLAASPDHAAAFEAVDRVWSEVGSFRDLRGPVQRPAARVASRRALLAGVGLLAVTGVVAAVPGTAPLVQLLPPKFPLAGAVDQAKFAAGATVARPSDNTASTGTAQVEAEVRWLF